MDANCRECNAGLAQATETAICWYCPEHGQMGLSISQITDHMVALKPLIDLTETYQKHYRNWIKNIDDAELRTARDVALGKLIFFLQEEAS